MMLSPLYLNPDVVSLVEVVVAEARAKLLDDVFRQPGIAGGDVGFDLVDVLRAGDGGGDGVIREDEAEGAFDQGAGSAADDRLHLVDARQRFLEAARRQEVLTDVVGGKDGVIAEL